MNNVKPVLSSPLQTGLSYLITLLVPVVLVLTAVRLLLTPAYLRFEYSTPLFPADPYGFTRQERQEWAEIAITYLVNDADISFLGDLRFPEGQSAPPQSCQFVDDCTRLYNERELKHMVDVKNVVQAALKVWISSLVVLVGLGLLLWRSGAKRAFFEGLRRGGWLTVALLGGILAFVLLAFGLIFVAFHNVFFEAGTWTFYYSDTLIRLFPERFWRDTFIAVGILGGGGGWLLAKLHTRE